MFACLSVWVGGGGGALFAFLLVSFFFVLGSFHLYFCKMEYTAGSSYRSMVSERLGVFVSVNQSLEKTSLEYLIAVLELSKVLRSSGAPLVIAAVIGYLQQFCVSYSKLSGSCGCGDSPRSLKPALVRETRDSISNCFRVSKVCHLTGQRTTVERAKTQQTFSHLISSIP